MNKDSDKSTASDEADAVVKPWIDYWTKLFEQNSDWAKALMAGTPEKIDPTVIRKQWLDAMTKSIESYMRTPSFLEAMRQNSDAITATKVTSELAKLEAARQVGIPHIEDIHGLYVRLESANEALHERLKAIEERLAAIENSLDAKPKKATGKNK